MGSCWRLPGVHFKVYEVWGNIMPPEAEMQSKCLDCFGAKRLPAEPESEDEESASSSSSSSSSGGPPAKKGREL